ncbi:MULTISPECIES: helix-turn-helix transcriptional regulator [unclassified Sphingomonas]|uniref:helix-turn-helix transcriptional regulator n=1 Tax=unclassified Sphingomonas TaxID=196159 RepID=UPI0006FF5C1C|nr:MULTISPECIES: hypothetical protein [unclassified Sphingomonas]KQM24723.1 hypothetical protein ASE58_15060 [Sphingomonas sp. Leaf9]KQM42381.1 hypothetical protein ASE57_15065 [Sphingomonas sp. Leaf11]
MLDALCSALSVRSAVVQIVQESASSSWEAWTSRDSHSTRHAERHDSCLNRPDSPRFQLLPGHVPHVEISSDQRSFGTRPDLIDDLRGRTDRAGLGIGLWASFPIGGDRTFSLILHRHPGDMRDLTDEEERDLTRLLPHLQQAVRLNARIGSLQRRADTLGAVSSHVHAGLLLCDADLTVDWCNAAAIEVLACTSLIARVAGRLRCARSHDGERLRDAAQAVARGAARVGRVVLIGDDGASLHLRIVPTADAVGTSPAGTDGAALAVMLSLPDSRMQFDVDDVAALFDLSPAEARLTSALAGGASITEYAATRGIATGTARVQLNRILSKTGTQRQADLVRVVHGSPARRSITAP